MKCCGRTATEKPFRLAGDCLRALFDEFTDYYACRLCTKFWFSCKLCLRADISCDVSTGYKYVDKHKLDIDLVSHLCADHISEGSVIAWDLQTIIYSNYFIRKHTEDYKSANIGWGGLLHNYSQLLFIKQIDMDINTECVIREVKNNSTSVNENAATLSHYPGYRDDFYCWFIEFIMQCNYKCTNCGDRYEDGMPPLDIVLLHLNTCPDFPFGN